MLEDQGEHENHVGVLGLIKNEVLRITLNALYQSDKFGELKSMKLSKEGELANQSSTHGLWQLREAFAKLAEGKSSAKSSYVNSLL